MVLRAITHNSVALVGLTVIFLVVTLVARPELRHVNLNAFLSHASHTLMLRAYVVL